MSVDGHIRDLAERRHLPAPHLERWLKLDEDDSAAVFVVAESLRLRTGQIVELLDLLSELSLREGEPIATLLRRAEFHPFLVGRGSAPERARGLLEHLRALRFPRLTQTIERLNTEIRSMNASLFLLFLKLCHSASFECANTIP